MFDVSGAGDTVVATLAASLAAGSSLLDAARLANVAAGIVVGKTGTAITDVSEIAASLRRQDMQISGELKVLPLDAAVEQVAAWRAKGERVGFTNGCFDLIHPGHVAILAKSRAACDRLVVGLNADESVKRLKGESRPVQNEAARAAVMASLASVDLVVLFADDTPVNLIEALTPRCPRQGRRLHRRLRSSAVNSFSLMGVRFCWLILRKATAPPVRLSGCPCKFRVGVSVSGIATSVRRRGSVIRCSRSLAVRAKRCSWCRRRCRIERPFGGPAFDDGRE